MTEAGSFELVDPDLREAIALFPPFTPDQLPAFRELSSRPDPFEPNEGLLEQRLTLDGPAIGESVDIIVCRPRDAAMLPAICCIHGGGFVTGSAAKMASQRREWALDLNCVLVFVDYSLAPEHPFPRPLEDCYRALAWMHEEGRDFGIDPARIAVSGMSAGGGLAAALAILARDRDELSIAFQHLLCPMLDDRTAITPDPHPYTGEFVWTRENNRFGWSAFLGREPGGEGISAYAAPARVEDMHGLPPTYLAVGTLDLFLDENLEYARRLTRAGIPTELHVYPGVYHGASAIAGARVSIAWERDSRSALKRALHGHEAAAP